MALSSQQGTLLQDGFLTQWGGTDSGVDPSLLDRDKNSFAVNCIGRGGILTHRPTLRRIALDFDSAVLSSRFTNGRFQVASVYTPDKGIACILCSVGGRQFRLNVGTDNSVQEITIQQSVLSTADFTVPAVDATQNLSVDDSTVLSVGAVVTFGGANYTVSVIVDPTTVTLTNIDGTPADVIPSGTALFFYDLNPATKEQAWCCQAENFWILQNNQNLPFIYDGATSRRANSNLTVDQGREIPVGNVMEYAMGRIAVALPDNRTFAIGDLVGSDVPGAHGPTFRDAPLKFTQNTFLGSGRNFTVPQNAGGITAMRAIPTLDAALGQGPLMVFTPSIAFTVQLPTDETLWAQLANPIQTVSLITNGSTSQNSTILVNGDIWYRSNDGWRSLVLARRDFNTWANTPVSSEMIRVLAADDPTLLNFASACYFDGRMLMTVSPGRSTFGTFHRGLIALDLNRVSGLREKLPPAYDGLWTGVNATQMISGNFNGKERCFIFSVNYAGSLELFELLKDGSADELGTETPRITWSVESGLLLSSTGQRGAGVFDEKRLENGEVWIDEVFGEVTIKSWFRPVGTACWVPWRNNLNVCAVTSLCTDLPTGACQDTTVFKPQYRSRLAFGRTPDTCEEGTRRPAHTSEGFQIRLQITGHCRVRGLRVLGRTVEEPGWKASCAE